MPRRTWAFSLGLCSWLCFVGPSPRRPEAPRPGARRAPATSPDARLARGARSAFGRGSATQHGHQLWWRLQSWWPWKKPHYNEPAFVHAILIKLQLLWKATGLGPWLGLIWSALSPYPPFSWMQWAVFKARAELRP
ncbi:unnamed protein product [Effrenium voratum]|uniref:Uncharacterized protein n=1 Tax=Effrenium voratum TaxID=2562239 RepID=A0AA36IWW9_9DINO|nr:unnamed protein product [Effrenium voratum]